MCADMSLYVNWVLADQIKLKSWLVLKFLCELVVGEETKHVGPCGTCGAIRVGAVSALFAPNAKRRWREHRGPSVFMMRWMGVGRQ